MGELTKESAEKRRLCGDFGEEVVFERGFVCRQRICLIDREGEAFPSRGIRMMEGTKQGVGGETKAVP